MTALPASATAFLDRGVLWQAHPAGFLAVPGLATVDGYRYVAAARWPLFFGPLHRLHRLRTGYRTDYVRAAGGLLPLYDPADAASWAILCADLAQAAGLDVDGATGFDWMQSADAYWCLHVYYFCRQTAFCVFEEEPVVSVPSDRPSEALALARIYARERFGR